VRKILNVLGVALAFAAGAAPAFFIIMAVFLDIPSVTERLFTFALVFTVYGAIGMAFGFALPRGAWRWGIWAAIPVLIITDWYSIHEPWHLAMHFFYLTTACASGCLGGRSGAAIALRMHRGKEHAAGVYSKTNNKTL
jgi:hypothetical protein